MEALRIGIAGAGVIVRDMHLATFRRHPERFRVVAIADPDADAARARACEMDYGEAIRIYASHQDLVADDQVDVVLVATPPFLLVPVACDCLAAGKHVVSEKPMGNTEEDARHLLEVSRSARGQLMVAENFFFSPHYRKLREYARTDSWPFGPPLFVELHQFWKMTPRTIPQYYHSPWRHDPRLTWGYLIEGGCHSVNPLRETFGMVQDVQSRLLTADPKLGRYDTLLAHGAFAGNGPALQITMSYGTRTLAEPFIQVYARAGTVAINRGQVQLLDEEGNVTSAEVEGPGHGAYVEEWLHFYEVVANGARLEFSPEQSYGDVLFVQRLIDAARTGQ